MNIELRILVCHRIRYSGDGFNGTFALDTISFYLSNGYADIGIETTIFNGKYKAEDVWIPRIPLIANMAFDFK